MYGTVEMVDSDDGFAHVWGRSRRIYAYGRSVAQGLMGALFVVVPDRHRDGVAQGVLAPAEDLAQDEILEGLDEPLDVAILPRLAG